MEISLENLFVDLGTERVKTCRVWQQREGTLGFQGVDVDHEGEVNFKFSARILKKIDTPENFILLFFSFLPKK